MNDNAPIAIKDVLADPSHPAHNGVRDAMEKLGTGEISMCACMGPMYGEPHCYCTMQRLGLPLNQVERDKNRISAEAQLEKLFGPGGAEEKGASLGAADHLEDWQQARLAYTEDELYRLIVARALLDGQAQDKAEFDAQVRQLGDIDEADKLIAFRARRPGCIAVEFSGQFECACGVSWAADGPEPACKRELLK